MPRFVILEHDWPTLHWDFLLESGPILRAWRLYGAPASGLEVRAESNHDHRPLYLDYEGPLSGDRGRVKRWDAGTFAWITDEPTRVEVTLHGKKLICPCVMARDNHDQWSVNFLTVQAG